MSAYFEKIGKYANVDLPMPTRGTARSAGYDLCVAEDTVIPPLEFFTDKLRFGIPEDRFSEKDYHGFINPLSLDEMADYTKSLKAKPTLVPTGMKCHLDPDQYLELSLRSSTPLKYWLIMANSIGIIDADYWNNGDNEGHIFFQLINLSPYAIQLKRGDKLGQGIIKTYGLVKDDDASGTRQGGFGSTGNG